MGEYRRGYSVVEEEQAGMEGQGAGSSEKRMDEVQGKGSNIRQRIDGVRVEKGEPGGSLSYMITLFVYY